jgi:VanZ family protein
MNKFRIALILPVIILSAAIFYLSSQSEVPVLEITPLGFDKVLHFLAFFIYSIFALFFFISILNFKKLIISKIFAILLSLIFAISDEYHQSMIIGRDASIYDFIADAAGILTSSFLYTYFIKKIKIINERYFSTFKN